MVYFPNDGSGPRRTLHAPSAVTLSTPRVTLRLIFKLCALASCVAVSSCAESDDHTVTISGDVPGLDTIAMRGDSLFAQLDRAPARYDSVRAMLETKLNTDSALAARAALTRPAKTAVLPSSTSPRIAPSLPQRGQLMGDSIARAEAARMAGLSRDGSRARGDTVRGVVALLGAEPARQVVLRTGNGNTIIALSGMATMGMTRLANAEIVVRGVRISPRDIVVSDFFVRASGGVPAFDGKLAGSDSSGYWLQLSDGSGRKRLSSIPSALRGLEGARMWIAIKPGTGAVQSYGLIGSR